LKETIVVKTHHIVISIRDPNRPRARLRRPPAFVAALHLFFHDAEPMLGHVLPKRVRLMSQEDSERIWQFVQDHLDQVGTIVCHCEQGMSRSPAIALALAEKLNGDSKAIRADGQPDQYVYRLMRDVIAR
jgi:predicted protein tyrosine phosphatase